MFKKSYFVVFVVVLLLSITIGFFVSKNNPGPMGTEVEVESPVVTGEASYYCADKHTVQAVFMTQGPLPETVPGLPPTSNAYVSLSLDGALSLSLLQAISADGARYATADESLVFWSKGSGALVLENGKEVIYKNCIAVATDTGSLPQVYLDQVQRYTLRYPVGYTVEEAYTYGSLASDLAITGTKFTIPAAMATGTNLSKDTYISIEHHKGESCSADDFLPLAQDAVVALVEDAGVSYSVASYKEAGAGNRYEEYVYALADSQPCLAIRYYIHYTALENYDTDTVVAFDKTALLAQFDSIRRSLTTDFQFVPETRLVADALPLYEEVTWQEEVSATVLGMQGYLVTSNPLTNISDIAAVTLPFEKYYNDLLTKRGWEEDITMAAGGPGSAIASYKKGSEYIVLQYASEFGVVTDTEPAQCPCAVSFAVFSGSKE